eukprot:g2297.t1
MLKHRQNCSQKCTIYSSSKASENYKYSVSLGVVLGVATVAWSYHCYTKKIGAFRLLYKEDEVKAFLEEQAAASLDPAMKQKITDRVFFDVEVDDEPAGRIIFGLFGELAPRTAENFRKLCTGEVSIKTKSGDSFPLHFKGSLFHRAIPKFMVQGGDITRHDGSGGWSIYGRFFDDETFELEHSGPGLLSMANSGKGTNSSQFFITTGKAHHLDGKHVIFGRVLDGVDTVQRIELAGTKFGEMQVKVKVVDCGII